VWSQTYSLRLGTVAAATCLSLVSPPPSRAQNAPAEVRLSVTSGVLSGTTERGIDLSVEPNGTLDLTASCVDTGTGAPIPFCDVELTVVRTPLSGGHDHDDASRPIGSFDPSSGNTGADGLLAIIFSAPNVGGIDIVTLTGVLQDGTPITPGVFDFGIEVTGLVDLGAGANYDLVGATANHDDNHYGTGTFNSSLVILANSYAAAFPGSRLAYNDMSLVTGGLFDIAGGWRNPHRSHRLGVDLDLRLVAPSRRPALQQLILQSGISIIIVEGNHWHIRQ